MSMAFDEMFENRVEKLELVQNIEEAEQDDRVFNGDDPRQWATRFIRDGNLQHFQGGFYDWSCGAYRRIADEVIEAKTAKFLSTCWTLSKKDIHIPFKTNRNSKAEIMSALRNIRILDVEPPCWINRQGKTASEMVSFPNGLLHVPTGEFTSPTSNFFTLTAQDFDYDPDAPEPKKWLEFLEEMWEPESRECLMQYFGYLLSGDTSLQKILLIIGPPGSGKSTIMRVMEHVLGRDNAVSTDSESLSDRFGLELLMGKSIAFLPDEDFDYRTSKVGIDRLKRISGCDTVAVRPMRQSFIPMRLPVRFVITTNETPRLRASAEAMIRRFVTLRTPPFEGAVDVRLTDKLYKEAPGILNLAIGALKKLIAQGSFIQPESGNEDLEEIRVLGDSVTSFIDEIVLFDSSTEIDTYVLYDSYGTWAEANGEHKVDSRMFGRQLRNRFPQMKKVRRRGPAGRRWVYEGLSIDQGD